MEEETPNQKSARLRRERREAKLKAESVSRLEKISKVAGRQHLPDTSPPQLSSPLPPSTGIKDLQNAAQLPNLNGQPTPDGPLQPTEDDILALLRASMPEQQQNEQQQMQDDPMLKIFSQLMGEMPRGDVGGQGSPPGLPPGLATLMGSMGGSTEDSAGSGQQQKETVTYDYIWKIVHAIFAFALAVYVVSTSKSLAGPLVRVKGAQKRVHGLEQDKFNLFWAFATVELMLQSTRYFLERGRTGSGIGGMMGTVSSILPQPWCSYLGLVARYSGIWSTIVEDACVFIFVVGVFNWWNDAVG